MPPFVTLRTERLLLRQWRPDDRDAWAALNADPRVMAHFPAVQDRSASDAFADRAEGLLAERGWGWWAVEVLGGPPFVGVTGLGPVPDDIPVRSASGAVVEVGWRLAHAHWGRGYAPEAARAALAFAFGELGLAEVVSFTSEHNVNSRRVMTKIGMRHDPAGDFDHPRFPDWEGRRHVLYRVRRPGPPQADTVRS